MGALWYVNGELSESGSLLDQSWSGGAEGTNWWVCLNFGADPLTDGLYELVLQIDDTSVGSNTVWVGDSYQVNDLEIVNNTGSEVCYLYVSPTQAQNWGPTNWALTPSCPLAVRSRSTSSARSTGCSPRIATTTHSCRSRTPTSSPPARSR